MYLEPWMIVIFALLFGCCAYFSRRKGFQDGAMITLQALEFQRIIKVEDDGTIKRWSPFNDLPVEPVKRKRTNRQNKKIDF